MATQNSAGQYSAGIQKLLTDIDNYGKVDYSEQSGYKDVLDKLLSVTAPASTGRQTGADTGSFTYDPAKDPTWSSYRKTYLREGDRATRDTLAKASVATGGVPSSYAITAAQQAQNYYNSQMADALPTLRQNAYQEYLDGYDRKQSEYSKLLNLITTTGFIPDATALSAAGMTAEEAAAWKAYYDRANAPRYSRSTGGNLSPESLKAYIQALGGVAADGLQAGWQGVLKGLPGVKVPSAYENTSDTTWNSLFSGMSPQEVSQTVNWLVSSEGIDPSVLQPYLNAYGPRANGASINKGINPLVNMLR